MAGGRPGLRLDSDFFPFAVGRGHPTPITDSIDSSSISCSHNNLGRRFLNLFLTVYSSIFLQNRGLRNPSAAQGPQPNLTSRIATVRGCANHDAMRLIPDGRDSNTLPQNRL